MDLSAFETSLTASGIDVVQPFDVRWYNTYIQEEGLPLKPLPTFGRKSGAAGVLLGNSKALWPAFLTWLGKQPSPAAVADPLDTYLRAAVEQAMDLVGKKSVGGPIESDIVWPWEGGARLCSMQRVAVCSGLCYHDSETQLAVHPIFGAWLAFRAVVVFDATPTALKLPSKAPERLGCLLSDAEKSAARAAMAAALRASDEANLCTQLHGAKGMEADVRLAWAALRDCVRVGKEHKYSDDQLIYHYTKEKAVLHRALREHGAGSASGRTKSGSGWLLLAVPAVVVVLLAITYTRRGG